MSEEVAPLPPRQPPRISQFFLFFSLLSVSQFFPFLEFIVSIAVFPFLQFIVSIAVFPLHHSLSPLLSLVYFRLTAMARIYYESLLARDGGIESQGLLVPVLLELDSRDVDLLMRHQEHFEDSGFSLESFGGLTVQISSIPALLKSDDLRETLIGLIDAILDRQSGGATRRLAFEGFAAKVARVGSMQISWNPSQIPALLEELFQCDLPYCDSAGRPTMIQISHQELDRKFGKS